MSMRIDMTEFNAALREYIPTTKKELPDIMNERLAKVIERTWDAMPPNTPAAVSQKRFEIAQYLSEPRATYVKLATSGKRKGKFIRSKAKGKQLMRVHLILQARRAKKGLKGLYGKAMRKASGAFRRKSAASAGFLKSHFLPIIRTLNLVSKWKIPWWKTKGVSRWPGSAGYGKANPAKLGWNPVASFDIQGQVRDDQIGKVQGMFNTALNGAFAAEARELSSHVARKMQRVADRHNAR